jgi:hypothetical protein
MAVKFPCMKCGKAIPKSRRIMACEQQEGTQRECCSSRCWRQVCDESDRDMASEARSLGPAESGEALERLRDYEFHRDYPDE